jgi:phenylalanyl-tRNA synthetase alpha subunit
LDHANKKAWYRLLAALSEVDKASFREVARASPDVPELKGLVDKALPRATSKPCATSKLEGLAAWSQIHFSWSMAPDLTSTRTSSETRHVRTAIRDQARSLFVKKDFEEARGLYIEAQSSHTVKELQIWLL